MEQGKNPDTYSYSEYQKAFSSIYRDERLEAYYYSFLKDFLKESCTGEQKVVRVHDNRYRNEEGSKIHRRDVYAEKNGVPDLIVVSKEYSYEKTSAPYVSVEIKRPDVDIQFEEGQEDKIMKYTAIKWKTDGGDLDSQLETEFRKTDYIIYTDCITWYFLKKTEGNEKKADEVYYGCLFEGPENAQKWASEGKWIKLKEDIRSFMQDSRIKDSQGQNHAADA